MKLIQAMKRVKDLTSKAEDLRKKIALNCADLTIETPTYGDEKQQKAKIEEWLQAHGDILREILRLRVAIQRTNLMTYVTIELEGKPVTKSIAEWIHRRRDLAKMSLLAWASLTDRGLKEHDLQTAKDAKVTEVRIRRYFDPSGRDLKLDLYRSEPSIIDGALEVTNAITELQEAQG